MLVLHVEAPFAVFRTFTAGWYRPTATFLTPSAAYGLLLNVAGIETRLREEDEGHKSPVSTTLTRSGLPALKIALGIPVDRRSREAGSTSFPLVQTLYQQTHVYPVNAANAATPKEWSMGNKPNISPVRRELLYGLRALIAVDENPTLEEGIRRGLSGNFSEERYGLPFLGDNSFLLDRLDIVEKVPAAVWYERLTAHEAKMRSKTTRLTVRIDRSDFSKTESALYAPASESMTIPDLAWTTVLPH